MRRSPVVAGAAAGLLLCGCGGHAGPRGSWPLPNRDVAGTRAAADSRIDARNVATLRARWRFRFTAKPSFSGIFASTPIVDADTVYVEDLRSSVFALDRSTGATRWTRRYRARNDGPNGLAVAGGRVYGATDSDAFALSASTGEQLWLRHLTGPTEQFVDVAPVVRGDLVYLSTVGYPRGGRGAVYGLDAANGAVRWKFVTIRDPWRFPEAGGGGLWDPVSVDAGGRVYGGNSNPAPWGGTPKHPNGGAYPGPVPYTDSLLVLDGRSGRLLWHDQVTPHDIRDYDFQDTPVLARVGPRNVVFGAGKAGRVVAWDRDTQQRLWLAVVGLHLNDLGPLPRRWVPVCPGLLGGVETPLAYADGRLFVPVVDLCARGNAVARQEITSIDPTKGRGLFIALDGRTGRRLWARRFPSPDFGCATVSNDVVFTSTYDGMVYALAVRDGRVLWHLRMRAGVNACPAVAGDLLLVGAGVPRPGGVPELVAFGL
ncbi:MAG TPA: PQQ-binding-like beta-propeller repeat protein [Gaiellaceae bacterium]